MHKLACFSSDLDSFIFKVDACVYENICIKIDFHLYQFLQVLTGLFGNSLIL